MIERRWHAQCPNGESGEVLLRIGAPAPHPRFEWACTVELDEVGHREQHTIYGVDGWQAVQLAMSLVIQLMENSEKNGWRFFWDAGYAEPAQAADLRGGWK